MTQGAPIEKLVIVGGGSAGWMAAAAIANATNATLAIEVVESEAIGIVGVGEATIPAIKQFNQLLGIPEVEFVKETQGSFKLGIEFVGWGGPDSRYFHPFGTYSREFDRVSLHHWWLKAHAEGKADALQEYSMAWVMAKHGRFGPRASDPRLVQSTFEYAYHFDTILYGQYLRRYAQARGVTRTEGKVVDVALSDAGHVSTLTLEDGRTVSGDFFVDCTGFYGLLIEGALQTGYEDWTRFLPADRAVAVPCEMGDEGLTPYTRSTVREAGWQWRIPLQHRVGNGYVYSSQYTDQQTAEDALLSSLEGPALAQPRHLRFTTGRRKAFWNANVCAIGLAAGFMEPLESTSIHLIQTGITRLVQLFPTKGDTSLQAQEYNRITCEEYEHIRDFLVLHYHANTRTEPLWQYVREMDIPDSLKWRLEHWKAAGRLVSPGTELFVNPSWLAVYTGQGVMPDAPDTLVHQRGDIDYVGRLAGITRVMHEAVQPMPTHAAFIKQHFAAREETLEPVTG